MNASVTYVSARAAAAGVRGRRQTRRVVVPTVHDTGSPTRRARGTALGAANTDGADHQAGHARTRPLRGSAGDAIRPTDGCPSLRPGRSLAARRRGALRQSG